MMKKIEDLTYMQMHANFNFVDFKSGKPLADLRYNLVENCEVNLGAIFGTIIVTICIVIRQYTVPIDRILSVKNARAWVSINFT